jgi:hypothetical protein
MGTIFSLKKNKKNNSVIVPGDLSFEKNDYIEIKRKPKPPNTPYPYLKKKEDDDDIWDEYDDGNKVESSPGLGEKKEPIKKVISIKRTKKRTKKKIIPKKKIIEKKNDDDDELKEYDDIIECDLDEFTNVNNVKII